MATTAPYPLDPELQLALLAAARDADPRRRGEEGARRTVARLTGSLATAAGAVALWDVVLLRTAA